MSTAFIDEYLVALKMGVDQPSLTKFQNTLKMVEGSVASSTGGMIGDIFKFQAGATGAFAAVGFGVIGYIDKLATADQRTRLFAQRNYQTLQQARSIQTALDVMGVSLEDVAWDKELHGRFLLLLDDQKQLAKIVGPQYENQMKQVRDVQFQLQRLEVKGTYFGMKFAGDLLEKLGFGDGGIEKSLGRLNDYILQNMPQWSNELSSDVIPVLHDFWAIMKGLGGLAEESAVDFTNFIGVLSGDDSLKTTTFDFHKFASAIETVAHWTGEAVEELLKLERLAVRIAPTIGSVLGHDVKATALTASGVNDILHGRFAAGRAKLGASDREFNAGTGALDATHAASVAAGPGVTGVTTGQSIGDWFARSTNMVAGKASTADMARQMAKAVSAKTGIAADLIFGQLAHETGNFTNRGSTDLNNFAGIRYPGTKTYQKYDTPEDFVDYYSKVLTSKRYTSKGILDAKTPEAMAHALKQGSYYEGPEDVYARQMRSFAGQYDRAEASVAPVTIGTINIPITQPGATRQEIASAVRDGVKDGIAASNRDRSTRVSGGFQ